MTMYRDDSGDLHPSLGPARCFSEPRPGSMTLEQEIDWLNQQMNSAESDYEADAPGVWDTGGWVDYARSLLQFSPRISTEAKREFCRMQGLEFREEYR